MSAERVTISGHKKLFQDQMKPRITFVAIAALARGIITRQTMRHSESPSIFAASISEPGVIAHVGTMARLRVGTFDASLAPRAKAFVDACSAAGIEAEHTPDIRRALWEKFVFLNAVSGLTCLARQPLGVIRTDAELRATFEASLRETIAVARAKGVEFPDDFVARQLRMLDGLPAEMPGQ